MIIYNNPTTVKISTPQTAVGGKKLTVKRIKILKTLGFILKNA